MNDKTKKKQVRTNGHKKKKILFMISFLICLVFLSTGIWFSTIWKKYCNAHINDTILSILWLTYKFPSKATLQTVIGQISLYEKTMSSSGLAFLFTFPSIIWFCILMLVLTKTYVSGSVVELSSSDEESLIESTSKSKSNSNTDVVKNTHKYSNCPSYGCPMLPLDMIFDETATMLETMMKKDPRAQVATLTLRGYKGGDPSSQINQDRAFVVSPFFASENSDTFGEYAMLGVFDGHGNLGERVSEYAVSTLPPLISKKMASIELDRSQDEDSAMKELLKDSFIETDRSIPTNGVGGCTASVILQKKQKIYIANAGDSASFLVIHKLSTNTTHVAYQSREDKPSLPEEMERVHKMGGEVYIPPPHKAYATSRVYFTDTHTGGRTGLAMSRSIGDWDAGKVGVIPDPLVDVVLIQDLLNFDFQSMHSNECVVQEDGTQIGECVPTNSNDDIILFAVSATDGMMDELSSQHISEVLAKSFQSDSENSYHLIKACETLIIEAAIGWQQKNRGHYRDDIAISVSKINIPIDIQIK